MSERPSATPLDPLAVAAEQAPARGAGAVWARPSLLDLPIDELPLPDGGQAFRRRQLADGLYRQGAQQFGEITSLPLSWRRELAERWSILPFRAVQRFPSADGSVRYLLTLADGKRTEAVYMPYRNRKTVCISSMVGCPAGCTFCATGALGFGRRLSRGEIVGQILVVAAHEGFPPREIRNVVLMGMGEALLNYDNAVGAVRTMIDPQGLALSPRRITLSTVGLPRHIRKLADERLPLVLAVSLHAPDEETRRQIIPTAHAHPLDEIRDALEQWQAKVGRRITIEYTLLAGINDHRWQAERLLEFLRGLSVHVNLIPFNPWPGAPVEASSSQVIARFRKVLEQGGVPVSVRFSRGRDAGGACGQLALREQGGGRGGEPGDEPPPMRP